MYKICYLYHAGDDIQDSRTSTFRAANDVLSPHTESALAAADAAFQAAEEATGDPFRNPSSYWARYYLAYKYYSQQRELDAKNSSAAAAAVSAAVAAADEDCD